MSEPFLGTICTFGFNFAPRGWAFCSGQFLSIAQNTALFSLLGTMYGGNGQTTFALPNLNGRTPVGMGTGAGLPTVVQGEMFGTMTTTLLVNNMPTHSHAIIGSTAFASTLPGDSSTPLNNYISLSPKVGSGPNAANLKSFVTPAAAGTPVNIAGNPTIGNTGGSQPFNIAQPSLGINYSIALEGIFPSRN